MWWTVTGFGGPKVEVTFRRRTEEWRTISENTGAYHKPQFRGVQQRQSRKAVWKKFTRRRTYLTEMEIRTDSTSAHAISLGDLPRTMAETSSSGNDEGAANVKVRILGVPTVAVENMRQTC